MREVIHSHIRDLTNLREKCNIMTHFWLALIVYFAAIAILVVAFFITSHNRGKSLEIPSSDEYRIDDTPTMKYYQTTIFGTSWMTGALGGYCGILV